MKGPGLRLEFDVDRIWECPECGKQKKRNGNVVAERCGCSKDQVWMRLVEPTQRFRQFDHQEMMNKIEAETSQPEFKKRTEEIVVEQQAENQTETEEPLNQQVEESEDAEAFGSGLEDFSPEKES